MKHLIALLGSGEYLPVMNEVDRYLLDQTNGNDRAPLVVCLPTAAGQEGEQSWGRWNKMGEDHFRSLGAEVSALPIIDRASADDPRFESILDQADLIYFSGGNPHYLYETMNGSRAWGAIQRAFDRGAIYAGCSAGAMILAKEIPDFRFAGLTASPAFGSIPATIVFPHFDRWRAWRGAMTGVLQMRLNDHEFALGIDEDTAVILQPDQDWLVMGRQSAHVITRKEVTSFRAGESIKL